MGLFDSMADSSQYPNALGGAASPFIRALLQRALGGASPAMPGATDSGNFPRTPPMFPQASPTGDDSADTIQHARRPRVLGARAIPDQAASNGMTRNVATLPVATTLPAPQPNESEQPPVYTAPKPMRLRTKVLRDIAGAAAGAGLGAVGAPQQGAELAGRIGQYGPEQAAERQYASNMQDYLLRQGIKQKSDQAANAAATAKAQQDRDEATAAEANARAGALKNPPAPKVQHVIIQDPADPTQPKMAAFDPVTRQYLDPDTNKSITGAKPWEKPEAGPKILPDIAAIMTTKGMPNKPPEDPAQAARWWETYDQLNKQYHPSFADTGLFEPVTDANGRTVKFDRRTGNTSAIKGVEGGAPVLSSQQSAELKTAEEDARGGDTRLRVMQANLPRALKGDQQAMVSLLANHIGMTLGMQKGARINQAVWQEALKSAPWLSTVKARFSGTGPNAYLTGVTLTPEQMQQMVELGTERRKAQWQQVHDTMAQFGATDFSHVIPKDMLAPENASAEVYGKDGKTLIGHVVNGKYVALPKEQ